MELTSDLGARPKGFIPDVVGSTLIELAHEPPQLDAELGAHAVELECALAPSGFRGWDLCDLHCGKQVPARAHCKSNDLNEPCLDV